MTDRQRQARQGDDRTSGAMSESLARSLAAKRTAARLILIAERIAPRLLLPVSVLLLFLSAAWFGLFRLLPFAAHAALLSLFGLAFLAALIPLFRLRLPAREEADRMLEARNALPHQAIGVQQDRPATDGAFGAALWAEHQARMARTIESLRTGVPQPDIARFDRQGLRAVPVLLVAVAFAYSYSNRAGLISDAVHLPVAAAPLGPDVRIDAWVTPPGYTGRAPLFLTARPNTAGEDMQGSALRVPQFSDLTVRITGGAAPTAVSYQADGDAAAVEIPVEDAKSGADGKASAPKGVSGEPAAAPSEQTATASAKATTHLAKITRDGTLTVGTERWHFAVIPDAVPEIAFDGGPRATVNAALEVPFIAKDDYGLTEAFAEIVPIDTPAADARPLYPAPEYRLDLPRRNAKDAKAVASRNLSEHPLAGKRVRITLVARDAAGQEGRSQPQEMILPARRFFEPLAGAVAEERQVFALDANRVDRAIELNEAITLRPEENIPNLTHYLLLQSAKGRMETARDDDMLRGTADYLWEIALGIEDGNLSLAEKQLRDAQQKLSDALERNASDEEISKLMKELRDAMQAFMQALAEQAMKNPQMAQRQAPENSLTSRDLQKMMDQIENLAKSGSKDQARQMLSEMQRMMNNLQAGRQPQMQNGQDNSAMRQQMDKLGELMQQQQKLMEETFRTDQALRDRMQRGDPLGTDPLFDQPMPQEPGQGQPQDQADANDPMQQMTEEQLRQALKDLQNRQKQLEQQLSELQKGLEGMGAKPGKGFGEAGKEMRGATGQLGQGQGDQAVGSQGRALQALREGAQEMMNQMGQGQGPGQGPGQGVPQYGQNGRDPLGRRQQNVGPDFGDQVKVPDEIDTQRARQILEEIRRRLGTNSSPELERQYLERLLDMP